MIVGVLQARMSSSRLPGKVLEPILGEPMIGRQIERLRRSRRLDRLVVATSDDASDDALAAYCETLGVPVVRGPLDDVLERFRRVLAAYPETTTLVRLTADCPLADPGVVDQVIERHVASGADYTNNTMPERSFPHGLDVEAMRPAALLAAAEEARDPFEREHVTPFIYHRPDRFRLEGVRREPSLAELRWTVDVPQDLAFVRQVYGALYPHDPAFGSDAVAALRPNSS